MTEYEATPPATVGFMDIGTNSIRLVVVRLNANRSFTVLRQLKETVRLGEAEFLNHRLQQDAIDRAVAIVRQFAMLSRAAGAVEIVAVATAATREAANRRTFLQRIHEEADVEVHVVSGMEEARLIYLGVTSGVHLGGRTALCIDIGGGSTEIAVGTQDQHLYLNSLQLGAIRLTNRFLQDHEGPVPSKLYQRIVSLVRTEAASAISDLRAHRFDLSLGSSGTIESLADIASRMLHSAPTTRDAVITLSDLQRIVPVLCSMSLDERRRRVPGLSPARADIIIGGAAILETLMDDLGLSEVRVSERGLREGLLVDYLRRHGHTELIEGRSVRERSVLQLGRSSHFDEEHALSTASLATALFDSARRAGLHNLGADERELLRYAALLHHIGAFLTHTAYQRHSDYMVRNADLLGFDQTEIALIASTVRYHRGATMRRRGDPDMAELSSRKHNAVRVMSMLLRLAESLDRSQAGVVEDVTLTKIDSTRVVLQVSARHGWEVERSSVEAQARAFERTFGSSLVVEAIPAALKVS